MFGWFGSLRGLGVVPRINDRVFVSWPFWGCNGRQEALSRLPRVALCFPDSLSRREFYRLVISGDDCSEFVEGWAARITLYAEGSSTTTKVTLTVLTYGPSLRVTGKLVLPRDEIESPINLVSVN